jgi:hypothetical protein
MTARGGTHFHSFDMHCKILQRQVTHLRDESDVPCERRLIESEPASQRRFKRAAGSPFYVILHQRLEENIDLVADRWRDVQIGAVIQCGCPIVGVEEIDAKPRHWESSGFASPRRAGNDEHSGRHLSAEIAVRPVPHILWNIEAQAFAGFVGNAQALQLFRRSPHALSRPLQMRIGLRF